MKQVESPYRKIVFICVNEREPGQAACGNRGSATIAEQAKEWVRVRGLKGRVRVSRTRCLGLCSVGPNLCIYPDDVWYNDVHPEDLESILIGHLGSLLETTIPPSSDRAP